MGLDAPILSEHDLRWERLRFRKMPDVGLRDRFQGALIGGAIGDAMGRSNEGVWPSEARERRIRAYQPWHGRRSGPKGTITDDTQMTMWLAESMLASARRAEDAGTVGVQDCVLSQRYPLMAGVPLLEPIRRMRPNQPHFLDRKPGGRMAPGWNPMVPTPIFAGEWEQTP